MEIQAQEIQHGKDSVLLAPPRPGRAWAWALKGQGEVTSWVGSLKTGGGFCPLAVLVLWPDQNGVLSTVP